MIPIKHYAFPSLVGTVCTKKVFGLTSYIMPRLAGDFDTKTQMVPQ